MWISSSRPAKSLGFVGVEIEPVRVGRRGDEQVGEATVVRTTGLRNRSHYLPVAPCCGGVEHQWLTCGFHLLQTALAPSTLGACRPPAAPRP